MIRPFPSFFVAVLLGATLVVGCSECVRTPAVSAQRLITDEPARVFDPNSIYLAEDVFLHDLTAARSRDQVSVLRSGRWTSVAEGVKIDSSQIVIEQRVSTGGVDVIEVDTALSWKKMELRWRLAEAPGMSEGIVTEPTIVEAPTGQHSRYRFVVSGHPQWTGSIPRLRLQQARSVVIHKIRGLRTSLRAGALEDALLGPWKVDFERDQRNALLALPGVPVMRPVSVPENAVFEAAYGAPKTNNALTFKVSLDLQDGKRVPIFAEKVAASASSTWHPMRVSLADYSGQDVVVVLETVAESDWDLARGVPAWSNPEVRTKKHRDDGPNVVLISIDTLRADHLSLYGYDRPTSPNLDAWAGSAVVFKNAIAQAPWTLPSHTSLFTGLNPFRHGVNERQPAPASLRTLPEVLRANGYATAAVTGAGFLQPKFGLAQGFDVFRYLQGREPDALVNGMAETFTLLETLASRKFFLFFHTYEPHTPYRARQPYFERFSKHSPTLIVQESSIKARARGDVQFVYRDTAEASHRMQPLPDDLKDLPVDLYDSAVAFVDQHFQTLLEKLETLGIHDNTIIVFTSDHGEMLGEHDLSGHLYMYEENIRVPLVISSPYGEGRVVEEQVRSIDVMPTILDMIGLSSPVDVDGSSLLALIRGEGAPQKTSRPAWSYVTANLNYALSVRIRNQAKYVRRLADWKRRGPRERFYDLRQDANELNAAGLSEDRRTPLQQMAQEVLAVLPGFRCHLTNDTGAPLRFRLHAPLQSYNMPKAMDPVDGLLSWDLGAVTVTLPAGDTKDLVLDRFPEEGARLLVSIEDFEGSFDLARIDGRQAFGRSDDGWGPVPAGVPLPATAVVLEWVGPRHDVQAATPESSDPWLREELKALGYLQ